VRIAAHLTEAATQTTLWSDKYDRGLDDIFAVQDEISEAIAEALNAAFFPQAVQKIDPLAYDLYLRGRTIAASPEATNEAIALLEAAVKLSPDFGDAWATLAVHMSQLLQNMPYNDRPATLRRIQDVRQECSQLDPDNALNASSDFGWHHDLATFSPSTNGCRGLCGSVKIPPLRLRQSAIFWKMWVEIVKLVR
jgi:tetratricopeptide (TPR) repeat protein